MGKRVTSWGILSETALLPLRRMGLPVLQVRCRIREVLIAEDNPIDAFLIKRAIEQAGLPIQPRFFEDGEQTLEYLQGKGAFEDRKRYPLPHLLLLDIKMPRKDGLELLRDIRKDPHLRRLIAIMFGSSSEPRDVDRAYDLGANAFMVKPTNSGELVPLMRRIHEFWFLTNVPPSGTAKSRTHYD